MKININESLWELDEGWYKSRIYDVGIFNLDSVNQCCRVDIRSENVNDRFGASIEQIKTCQCYIENGRIKNIRLKIEYTDSFDSPQEQYERKVPKQLKQELEIFLEDPQGYLSEFIRSR